MVSFKRKGLLVNVTVENLAPCKKLMRVEIESTDVDAAFESMIKDFQRQSALPGFRPGKAPKDMIARRYEKDIKDEVKKKLIPDAYRKAIDEQKLDVVGYGHRGNPVWARPGAAIRRHGGDGPGISTARV